MEIYFYRNITLLVNRDKKTVETRFRLHNVEGEESIKKLAGDNPEGIRFYRDLLADGFQAID